MPSNDFTPRSADEIETIRKAFVEGPVKLTLDELSEQFDVPRSTIGHYSAANTWSAQRESYWEKRAVSGEAMAIIAEAAGRVNRPVIIALTNAILALIQSVTQTIEDVDPERAPSTRAQVLNTCSFAIKNAADACKSVGIVGFPKELAEIGKTGQWSPQLLSQINVTVQNLANGAKSEPPKVEPTEEA